MHKKNTKFNKFDFDKKKHLYVDVPKNLTVTDEETTIASVPSGGNYEVLPVNEQDFKIARFILAIIAMSTIFVMILQTFPNIIYPIIIILLVVGFFLVRGSRIALRLWLVICAANVFFGIITLISLRSYWHTDLLTLAEVVVSVICFIALFFNTKIDAYLDFVRMKTIEKINKEQK